MVIAALSCAIVGVALVEIYGYLVTGTASLVATHVLAVVIGLVCAYGAIVTVLLRGMIQTLVDSVEWVAAELEQLTNGIVHQVETVEGAMLHHDHDQDEEQDGYDHHGAIREAVESRV